ncbi:MAG: 16S rRNA (cytosine967-C5)-methyltransferase [Puniceicoccaceae bacterium 5H]|nr:MAG: 16S rRNA (cytosine967-C5)-methyltransferase [Puniceicoccaceae bacterium 5H]
MIPLEQAWRQAHWTLVQYRRQPGKIDELLERAEDQVDAVAQGRLHWLVYGVVRHWRRLEDALKRQVSKAPRPKAEAALLLGFYELWADEKSGRAQVIDFVTEQSKKVLSKPEANFVHAVLRRSPEQWPETDDVSLAASHPRWLYERWTQEFGAEAAEALMQWDQQAPELWVQTAPAVVPPADWQPGEWPRFFKAPATMAEVRPWLEKGLAYVTDPSTRWPVEFAGIQPGMRVLDLCASPGGKSWQILQRLQGQGSLVAVDLAPRVGRLKGNLQKAQQPYVDAIEQEALRVQVIEADVLELTPDTLHAHSGFAAFDVVLLDAPCSNTGVLRRRPDAKWRLSPKEIDQVAALQRKLIRQAAEFVAADGALVYSTCSIEPQENEAQVTQALQELPFALAQSKLSRPDVDGHDGGGAFRLTRIYAGS